MARTASSSRFASGQRIQKSPGLLAYVESDTGVGLEAQASRLHDRRNGGANDVLAVVGRFRVALGQKQRTAGCGCPL